jgi:uncharacterized Fe-S cluster-containing protein
MSKSPSEANIREIINSSEVRNAIANGYTVMYQVNGNTINDYPQVGKKRKYPFDINLPNPHNGIKKFRSN